METPPRPQPQVQPLSGESGELDFRLMERVALRDFAAFEELLRRHQGRAWAAAARMLGDPVEAEDVVQEAFLRIFRAAPRYHPAAPFHVYLLQIVTRLCLDALARKRPGYGWDVPEPPDSAPDPEQRLQQEARARAVQQALGRLPARQRAVLVLKHVEGLSYSQIAQALGASQKSVDSLLQRARQSLRGLLRDLAY